MVANSKPLTPEQLEAFDEFSRNLQAHKERVRSKG